MGHARIAGIFEVVWATCMKCSEGFTKLSWSLFVCRHGGELFLLARATKILPLGAAYAVWTGIGARGFVIVDMTLFKEPATAGASSQCAIFRGNARCLQFFDIFLIDV